VSGPSSRYPDVQQIVCFVEHLVKIAKRQCRRARHACGPESQQGDRVIAGHQQVKVNTEMRDLQISGVVRTEDITNDSTVNLAQIAEARIGGQSRTTDFQQLRYGSRLFDILMPW
jgi:hypothetical protein